MIFPESVEGAKLVPAAFPGGFGPLVLRANRFEWRRRPSWNAPVDSERIVDIGYTRLHLYDGVSTTTSGLSRSSTLGAAVPSMPATISLSATQARPCNQDSRHRRSAPGGSSGLRTSCPNNPGLCVSARSPAIFRHGLAAAHTSISVRRSARLLPAHVASPPLPRTTPPLYVARPRNILTRLSNMAIR